MQPNGVQKLQSKEIPIHNIHLHHAIIMAKV